MSEKKVQRFIWRAMFRIGSFLLALLFLTAFGCGGGGDTGEDVAVNVAPMAEFIASAESGVAPLVVSFDASGSTDDDGSITGYAWTFGDGGTGSGFQVEHTYEDPGTYTVELTVTDNGGLTGARSIEIDVRAPEVGSQTYTISGTVTSAKNLTSDSDVNDINALPISNDTFEDAQEIAAPVSISGYVNVLRAGPTGASFLEGDTDDYYRAALTGGMTIALYMVENDSELNLYLYDDQQNLKDMTVTDPDSGIASLSVPAAGIYFVRVQASDAFFQTATGYSLTLGLANSTAALPALRLSDDFVPGEVIVRFGRTSVGTDTQWTGHAARMAAMGFEATAGTDARYRLLRRSGTADREVLFSRLGIRAAIERSMTPGNLDSKTAAKMETLWMVRAMREQAGVRLAEPNYIRRAFRRPTDDFYHLQWHYPFINLPDAWDITTGENDVVVAVVDTGVLLSHPDLENQLVDGYDFISDIETSLDGNGIDDDPNDPGDNDMGGSSFHGTHVAGTIAAETNNGGVAGVAWHARIMPLRALGKDGNGTTYDMLQAVLYAAGFENDSGIRLEEPVDIINLSLGSEGYSNIEAEVLADVRARGVIIVAAAGNLGTSARVYPAAYDGVVSVSAVTIDEELADYSSFGDTIDVAAPGGSSTDTNGDGYPDGILSTIGDDSDGAITMEYAFGEGTSMATSHVSGVVALMKSLYPDMTPAEFDFLLQAGYLTRDLGETGWDEQFGWGLIDAYKAVLVAREGGENGEIPAILSVSPRNLNFGADPSWTAPSTAEVTLQKGGDGDLSVTDVYTSAVWLSVLASPDVDDAGLGTYRITVSRSGLSDGLYTGTVTFESSVNTVSVSVVMRVGTLAETSGGYHYILLLDPGTSDPKAEVGTAGTDGVYEYRFPGLSKGDTYTIYAGTDPNNDFYICDEGELCGAYISLDEPVVLTVEGDMTNIDFTTNISISLPSNAAGRFAVQGGPLQRHGMREILE